MAVVVLDNRVSRIPIRIESFTIALALGAIGFVVLNHSIVRAPGPDGDVVAFRSLIGVTHDVVFDERSVGGDHDDSVAADVRENIPTNDDSEAGIPLRALPPIAPSEDAAAIHAINFVGFDAQIHEAARLLASRAGVVNSTVRFL